MELMQTNRANSPNSVILAKTLADTYLPNRKVNAMKFIRKDLSIDLTKDTLTEKLKVLEKSYVAN